MNLDNLEEGDNLRQVKNKEENGLVKAVEK